MSSTSINSHPSETCSFISLNPNHKKILQVALSIFFVAAIIIGVLSTLHHLPQVVGYSGWGVGSVAVLGFILVSCVKKKSSSLVIKPNDQVLVLSIKDLKKINKIVEGTGSGTCEIYTHNGLQYVTKKNDVKEFYAGHLFKLILGHHSPNMIFINVDPNNFLVGSQFDSTYQDIWGYNFTNRKLIDGDKEGLAKIIVASFLLGEQDLKGLSSAESNIGIIHSNSQKRYFKIDHGQAFLFGGESWREKYQMNDNWEDNLWKYCEAVKLTTILTREDLKKAAQQIALIPIEDFITICEACEKLCSPFPQAMEKAIDKETLFLNDPKKKTIKDAVIERITVFQTQVKKIAAE